MIDAKGFDEKKLEEQLSQPCPLCQGNHLALNCPNRTTPTIVSKISEFDGDKKRISVWDGAAWQEVEE